MKYLRRVVFVILFNLGHLLSDHPHVLLIRLADLRVCWLAFQVECLARHVVQALLAAWILYKSARDLVIFVPSQDVKLLHGHNEPANGVIVARVDLGGESVSVFVDGIDICGGLETLIVGFKHF